MSGEGLKRRENLWRNSLQGYQVQWMLQTFLGDLVPRPCRCWVGLWRAAGECLSYITDKSNLQKKEFI